MRIFRIKCFSEIEEVTVDNLKKLNPNIKILESLIKDAWKLKPTPEELKKDIFKYGDHVLVPRICSDKDLTGQLTDNFLIKDTSLSDESLLKVELFDLDTHDPERSNIMANVKTGDLYIGFSEKAKPIRSLKEIKDMWLSYLEDSRKARESELAHGFGDRSALEILIKHHRDLADLIKLRLR